MGGKCVVAGWEEVVVFESFSTYFSELANVMCRSYLVVDQNVLRTEKLKEKLSSEPKLRIVFPDLALLEITKNEHWELNLRKSLAVLSDYRQRVFVSRTVGESLKYELEHKHSVNNHMLFSDATQFFREILAAVKTETDGKGIARIRDDPDNHLQTLKRDYLNHYQNKEQATSLLDATESMATTEFAERARGNSVSRKERLDFVADRTPSLLVEVLKDYGFSREKAISLIRKKPMLLRYFYLKMWTSLYWLEMGRLKSLSEKKVTNFLLDHEYILTATFFNGIISNDQKLNEAHEDILQLLTNRI